MVKEDFKVTLQQPTMQHDFAMTEDYVIFLDFPLVSNPEVPSRACCIFQAPTDICKAQRNTYSKAPTA